MIFFNIPSKSSFDLLCNSYFYAYNFPVITTHCTNNFGKYQSKDKLIPLVIKKAINFKKIPVYGDGQQIRDWLFVKDHCFAILKIIKKGIPGNKYNIGSNNEIKNIDLVILICKILDKLIYKKKVKNFDELITFVKDTPFINIRDLVPENYYLISVDCADYKRLGLQVCNAFKKVFLNIFMNSFRGFLLPFKAKSIR